MDFDFSTLPSAVQVLSGMPIGAIVLYFLLKNKYSAQAKKTLAEAFEVDLRGEMSMNDFLQKRVLELERIRAEQSDLISKLRSELAEERATRIEAMRQLEEWKKKNGTAEEKISSLKKEVDELRRKIQ